MKNTFFLIAIVAMSLVVANPLSAQSRKDNKEAEKVQGEIEQGQYKDEAELPNQIKMDSIANAQKAYAVTCYRLNQLKSGWSKVTKHGNYNVEDKILIVENEKFQVCVNPYYGDDSTPGQYQYKAGPYYFNE